MSLYSYINIRETQSRSS